jgi:hypothetical protein
MSGPAGLSSHRETPPDPWISAIGRGPRATELGIAKRSSATRVVAFAHVSERRVNCWYRWSMVENRSRGLECRHARLRVASKAWVLAESDGKQPPVCLSVIRADTPEDLT